MKGSNRVGDWVWTCTVDHDTGADETNGKAMDRNKETMYCECTWYRKMAYKFVSVGEVWFTITLTHYYE
jgi:hypothetical protein